MKKILALTLVSFALFGASDKKVYKKQDTIMSESEGRALVKILSQMEKLGRAGRYHLVEALNTSSIPKLDEKYLPKLTDEQQTALNQILAQLKRLGRIGKSHLLKNLSDYFDQFLIFPLLKLGEQEIFDKIFAYSGTKSMRKLILTGNPFLLHRLNQYCFGVNVSVADKWDYLRNNITITDIRDKKLPNSYKKSKPTKYLTTAIRGLENNNPSYDRYQIATVAQLFLLICSKSDDKVIKEIDFKKLQGFMYFFFDQEYAIVSNDMSLLILVTTSCIKLIDLHNFSVIKLLTAQDLPYEQEEFSREIILHATILQSLQTIHSTYLLDLIDVIKPAFITKDGNNIVFSDPNDSSKYKLILSIKPN